MQVPREELEKKSKEINDSIFGRTRKKKVVFDEAVRKQVDASVKFALGKALQTTGIPEAQKKAFVSLLKEEPMSINLLLVKKEEEQKAIEMLAPLFGEKTKEFLENFQLVFNQLQEEIEFDRQQFTAG